MRTWSNFQKAIFEASANVNFGSFCVNAVAGSGKTTTIVECAKRAPQGLSILFLAFNKSIVNELQTKLPKSVDCKTLHSHGFRALMKAIKGRTNVNANKWRNYITEHLDTLSSMSFGDDMVAQNSFISNCANLLDKCRVNLVKGGQTRFIGDIADHFGIDLLGDEIAVVSTCLGIAYRLDNDIDFTDMITTSVVSAKRFIPKYDLIFVDEAQDLNKAEQDLLIASLTPNGRFIAVGDPKQAINGFAGADCDSFHNLARIANNNVLPLSVCYRCGKNIINLAKTYTDIEASENAIDGVVNTITKDFCPKGGDMILSRKSAPLVGLCLKLIANGISANVKGRDIAEGLKNLIIKTKAKTIAKLMEKLDKEIENTRHRAEKKGQNPETATMVANITDKVSCIEIIADTCTSVNEIITKLDNLFADQVNGNFVCLSTIHKAKGLEADNVYIIDPNSLPLIWKGQQPWEREQETNLCYVAYTRAKKQLTFVDICLETLLGNYQFNVA